MRFWQGMTQIGLSLPDVRGNETSTFPDTQCLILDGRRVADLVGQECSAVAARHGVSPKLVAVLAGEDPASEVYVKNKMRTFGKMGFASDTVRLSSGETTSERLLAIIKGLNADPNVHGILLQLPLPNGTDSAPIVNAIAPEKDVDGFLPHSMGQLACGDYSASLPCTPFGVMVLLAAYGIPLAGKHAVVVGRSNVVGKPMALLLLSADCTVTIAHSRTPNLQALCRSADILVAAAGRPSLITREGIREGATVVDVGIHRLDDGTLCGDVARDAVVQAGALTPVPGGVGPLTIAMLAANTLAAALRKPR